uniref:Uncharacterized protein n=1 Tax=Physcomitrium patens TaxID=3218 RepID=A0A2K1IRY8_PHYPA|nr:hypothetical protein PHYPA_026159 [Physcomitrium patens]
MGCYTIIVCCILGPPFQIISCIFDTISILLCFSSEMRQHLFSSCVESES